MKKVLGDIIHALSRTCGRDLSLYDKSFVTKLIEKRIAATAVRTPAAYLEFLAGNAAETEAFVRSLGITHSEFFRNPLTFALLEQLILPSIVDGREKSRREIRIWSAGCAAGQEPYSVAILLEELGAACGETIPYRIFASDVAEAELAVARKGSYEETAAHNVRLKQLLTYFIREGNSYTVAPRVRTRVDFSTYDLLDKSSCCPPGSIFGDFDLVFCCNLLFYYRQDVRHFILNKMLDSLSDGGFLVTGEAEQAMVKEFEEFHPVAYPAAIFRKE